MSGINPLLFLLWFAVQLASTQFNYNRPSPNKYSQYEYELTSRSCTTRTGDIGRCTALSQCAILRKQLREEGNQVSFILQQNSCRNHNYGLYVCCPNEEEKTTPPDQNSWTWPKPVTQTPTSRPSHGSTEFSNPWIPTKRPIPPPASNGKTNHQNRRLLPEDVCGVDLGSKIVGGVNTRLDEYPWMALIRMSTPNGNYAFGCGGALINERYVLTAAHCIEGPDIKRIRNLRIDKVRLGEYDLDKEEDCQGAVCSPTPIDVDIEKLMVHPGYKPDNLSQYNDIALVRLRRRVDFNTYVSPICLPLDEISLKTYVGEKLIVAGWGRTNNVGNTGSPIKQKVSVPVVPKDKCQTFYKRNGIQLRDTQICAGGEKNKDSCRGDSGGPLMSPDIVDSQVRWHVTGVVSFGPNECGREKIAGVYTRVADYVEWILDNMRD